MKNPRFPKVQILGADWLPLAAGVIVAVAAQTDAYADWQAATRPPAPSVQIAQSTTPAPELSPAPPIKASDEAYERSLNLSLAARKEVQRRLDLLGIKVGDLDGAFVAQTRAALRDWQIRNNYPPTGWLGPSQLATLNSQTQALYQNFLATQPTSTPEAQPTRDAATPARVWKKPVEGRKPRPAPIRAKTEPDYAPAPARAETPAPVPAETPSGLFSAHEGPCPDGFYAQSFPSGAGYRCVQQRD